MLSGKQDIVCNACHMAETCNRGQCRALKALRNIRSVMAFSSRDWSVDPELWAIHQATHGEEAAITFVATGAFIAPAEPRCAKLRGEGLLGCDDNRPEVMFKRTCNPACKGYQPASIATGIGSPGQEPLAVTRVSTGQDQGAASRDSPVAEKARLRPTRSPRRKGR